MNEIVVYRHPLSGHAHRVELLLSLLKLPHRLVDVDLAARAQKAPDEPYADVRAWLARIEALPGFVAMRPAPRNTP